MKRFSPVLALTALAATVALAQQTPPPAEPPADTPSTAPAPSVPNASPDSTSSANKQALMKDCLTQVKTANPGVPDQDIKNFCDKQINQPSPPHE